MPITCSLLIRIILQQSEDVHLLDTTTSFEHTQILTQLL
jgi:hypothetical protein